MRTVISYAGGKSKAYDRITPYIPFGTNKIVSPFIGGGSMEVRWSCELGIEVIGYDVFWHLVNFWNVLLNNNKELYDILIGYRFDKDFYNEVRERLLCSDKTQELFTGWSTDYHKREPIMYDNIVVASYYFYNTRLSYGPNFMGYMSSQYNEKKWNAILERVKEFSAPRMKVINDTFDKVIPRHSGELLYCDPPYYLDGDSKMCKGMYPSTDFDFFHKSFDHERLRDLLYNHKGGFILSYNNCDVIREWYKDYEQYFPEWHYSYGQGNGNVKGSHEILVVKR